MKTPCHADNVGKILDISEKSGIMEEQESVMNVVGTILLKKERSVPLYIGIILIGNLLMILSAYTSFYLPATPVPITLQTLTILAWSIAFGRKIGFAAVSLYIFEGIAGLPVFASGKAGVAAILGPTGGYIIGFLVASYVVSLLAEKINTRKISIVFFLMLLGNLLIYLFGVGHLTLLYTHSFGKSIHLGLLPFLVGDLYKIFAGCLLLPSLWRFQKK
ncbi:biotin transporter BioY [bacterium]|nr:biotin transporter BioY [bacterium]